MMHIPNMRRNARLAEVKALLSGGMMPLHPQEPSHPDRQPLGGCQ